MIQSRKIRYFLAAAKHLHFSAAAAELHISQPALSRSIRELEIKLGVPLFERTSAGVVLTRYGELLARRARLLKLEADHAIAELEAMKTGSGGQLRIGAGPLWHSQYLPGAICALHKQQPSIRIEIMIGVIDTLVPALLNGQIDLFCASLDFPTHPELTKIPLIDVRHTIVARRDHPLFRQPTILAENLVTYPWIVLKNDYVGRNKIGTFFVAKNLAPPKTTVIVSPGAGGFELAALGDYLAFTPEGLIPHAEHFNLCQVPVNFTVWNSPHGLVYRESAHMPPLTNAFLAIVKSHFQGGEYIGESGAISGQFTDVESQ